MKNIIKLSSIFIIALFFLSCGKKEEIKPVEKQSEIKTISELQKKGKDFFYLNSKSNNLKCADCHSDGTNDDNTITKFIPDVKGANKRTSTYSGKYKGEEVGNNGAGATFCYERFMMSKIPLTVDEMASLNAYYEFISKGNEPAEIKYDNIAIPEPDKIKLKEEQSKVINLTGDIKKGEELFNKACTLCHGENSKIKSVPKLFEEFDGDAKTVAFFVRFGKKFMPFFSYDKISTQDIADLAAFIISKLKK